MNYVYLVTVVTQEARQITIAAYASEERAQVAAQNARQLAWIVSAQVDPVPFF